MDSTVRVLMLDDQHLSRRGLELVLGAADGIEVVGGLDADAGDNLVIDLRPDVVLVGSDRRDPVGAATCSRVRAAVPQARIIVLTCRGQQRAEVAGAADGSLARNSSATEVADEILRLAHSQE